MMSLVEQLAASVGVTLPPEPLPPMPDPLDAVAPGVVFVLERKTTAEDITPGSLFWQRKTLDVQPTMYLAAEPRAEFVLYDVLRKPTADPHLATPVADRKYTKATKTEPSRLYSNQRELDETPQEYFARLCDDIASRPEWYYQRRIVVRLHDEMVESALGLWQTAQEILHARHENAWPMSPSSCFDFHSRCEFYGVCNREAKLDDPYKFETRPSKTRLPMLSASAVSTWGACHRKYFYAYEKRRRSLEMKSPALAFGTRIHAALEAWSLTGFDDAIASATAGAYDYDAAKAHAMLVGYEARWGGAPIRFIALEKEFEAELVHPVTGEVSERFTIGGTMDGLACKSGVADTNSRSMSKPTECSPIPAT